MDPDRTDLANAMPESKGLRETADEWWLDFVAIPKSARYVSWTPRSPAYRRGWGYALAESARFDLVDFTREDGVDVTGVVLREPTGPVFVAWFARARRVEAERAVACLNEEVYAIWTHWRNFAPERGSIDRQVTFEQGHEYAPDARWGLEIVTLADDGRYTFMLRRSGRLIAIHTGTIATARVDAVLQALSRSTFPNVPAHPFPPGASVLAVSMPPDRRVQVDRRFGLGLDGYREAIPLLMELIAEARAATPDHPATKLASPSAEPS
jgi:hypothetical protein